MIESASFISERCWDIKICELAKCVIHSAKYDKQGYLTQFVSELFDFLQYDSTRAALQWAYNFYYHVTMATYWAPDLDVSRFAYKSFRPQVDSPTSRSIRLHDQVVSPTQFESIRLH